MLNLLVLLVHLYLQMYYPVKCDSSLTYYNNYSRLVPATRTSHAISLALLQGVLQMKESCCPEKNYDYYALQV